MTLVLIVDDKPENVYYLEALFSGHGYRVQSAQHGAEALVRARSEPPDLIVTDLLMPVMDGYTLLRHWKADARLQRIPFVVYTATYTEPEDERLALSLGADAFILKPAEPDAFMQRIHEVEAAQREGRTLQPSLAPDNEPDLLKLYSQTLVRKLEEKTLQLEETNRTLQREIAERRRMLETQQSTLDALRDSEARFRQLAETINQVFWISDAQKTRMLYVSPAYAVIWGRAPEELYEHPERWLDAVHPDDRESVRRAVPGQKRGEYDVTYRVVRPDGTERWVRDRAFPVRDTTGSAFRLVGLAEDITERRTIEAQLLRAQRLESIGTLAGGIAHDLNNVLTPILMSIELLRLELSAPERDATLDAIEKSAAKGADMVRQVLAFARGVEGRREVLRVEPLLRDIEQIVLDTFLKSTDVRVHIAPDLPSVLGDQTQLHQVLLNLCVNARDAMPRGGRITLSASRSSVDAARLQAHPGVQAGEFVVLEVRDTGEGMTPQVIERIFDPFFTTKDVGRGTGLGLSTSLAIVKGHGGFIEVQSVVGEGTCFAVYLPASLDGAQVRAPLATARRHSGRGELILVVDDEAAIREISRRSLESFGYRVLLAADGAEAVSLFMARSMEIAVVVTDLMMPVMDGSAAIAAIRAINRSIPIIVVSGLANEVEAPRSADGALFQLAKPYRSEELLALLHEALHPAR